MITTPLELKSRTFDVVIVGAGIHGAVLARETARAGYTVALIEKSDFGSATSANSLKIVHGGVRYLQHANLKRMRESVFSRRSMMQFAPHLVKPLACLMPTYGHGMRGRELMRVAFGLYDLIAFDRNHGLEKSSMLPPSGTLGLEDCKRELPGIEEDKLNGAALWYDGIAVNTERLLMEYINEASLYGAVAVNYGETVGLIMEPEKVTGLVVRDTVSGEEITVMCSMVINTAGPWVDDLYKTLPTIPAVTSGKWAKALNLVVKKRFFNYAVGLEGWTGYKDSDALINRGKRLFFFVPWRNRYTMIGTNYTPYDETSRNNPVIDFGDIKKMVDDINKIYPAAQLVPEDVSFCHGGLLPRKQTEEAGEGEDTVQVEKSTRIIDHQKRDNISGLISVSGVKYTTAPSVARQVTSMLKQKDIVSPLIPGSYRKRKTPYVDHQHIIRILGENEYDKIIKHLRQGYGPSWRAVFSFIDIALRDYHAYPTWLCETTPLLTGEILYFIEKERSVTLADVVFRRAPVGSAECPGDDILDAIGGLMAQELGWDGMKQEEEKGRVKAHFAPLEAGGLLDRRNSTIT